jgi:hypothetical protein
MATKKRDLESEKWKATKRLRHVEADLYVNLEIFGDELAKRYKYKRHRGIEAVYFWIIERHHWLPSTVRAMNAEDLGFLLEEGMADWTLPTAAVKALKNGRAD